MTKIADELQINAKRLRQRAKAAETEWRKAKRIKRLSAKLRAGRRAEKRAARQLKRHRDWQLGKLGAASAVRIIKPE